MTSEDIALTRNDRLGVSLFGSFLIHLIIILGITFTVPKLIDPPHNPTLEITLVQTATDRTPKNPDYLAQANQDGGGNSAKPMLPSSPLPIRELTDTPRDLATPRPAPQIPVRSQRQHNEALTQARASRALQTFNPAPERRDLETQPEIPGLVDPQTPDQERARLSAEISQFWQQYSHRPRVKWINARTREYKYAAYMEAWRAKVERIGNLNYPEEARRRGIRGDLILEVGLKPDGSLYSVRVIRSSGYKVLDDAAVRIVELAAPFAPFPPSIRKDTDILYITRTWKFGESLQADQ